LGDREGDESSVAEVRRMITKMFKHIKEDLQSNSKNHKRIPSKKISRSHGHN
jgi:hypothetical protein